mmetsp:Transcript_60930/g.188687  ORF Transcript_60930/g.188687 Transcript_60930/m.188687 type:complete len:453 (-) Transcript_60930:86-1444(-)|eukprot:CAMPEP_0204594144 /NCGR_PEP_ID=MMETSP0661-20131031/51907_1 /ASSEMBLY_ACC=CAM_ASM_000606 /TAXON_ID=109239 /ORGANISM="Alexandrium margalefi, Strain AMGDE01CS-322" /LENGTH=452 /DNA_ID=CAMNT_0051604513 /DNA_START=73 /DNA_END=1431 /DNA_ORIENTATION=+
MQSSTAAAFLLAVCFAQPGGGEAATCTEVPLAGPFAPGRLMKCVDGLDVYRSTDPTSCPAGWKIWAPESREDWATLSKSHVLPVGNPHFLVDITSPIDGCGTDCGKTMNSDNPEVQNWKTRNGEKWWLGSTPRVEPSEPSGDYEKNCFLEIKSISGDPIAFNDWKCNMHSTDYLCQPAVKVDCTNRIDEITGPCKNESAIFRHSNCTAGVCEKGEYLLIKSATIDECKDICENGRVLQPSTMLTEEVYGFHQDAKFHDVSTRTPLMTRTVENIAYQKTMGAWPGLPLKDDFYVRWTGKLRIRTAGLYTFYTDSDDGSRLSIDGQWVIEHSGSRGMGSWLHGSKQLVAGIHPLVVESYEIGGYSGMFVAFSGPDTGNGKWRFYKELFAPEIPKLFRNSGPCVAYSMNAAKRCVIYTDCQGVGTGSTCDDGLILGDLTGFKTCEYPPTQFPSTA